MLLYQNFTMKKIVLGIVFISAIVLLVAWLWTLQPSFPSHKVLSDKSATDSAQQQTSNYDPPDFSILKTTAVVLKGKANSNQIIAISSSGSNAIIKTDAQGTFKQTLTLEKGLNLVKIAKISQDFKNTDEKILTYDVNSDTSAPIVFAGSVKTIFDTLITVISAGGEKSIRAGSSTAIDIPKEKETGESTPSTALESIRIGDYAIAVGDYPDEKGQTDTIVAQKITILRDNKPKNDSSIITGKTLTGVNKNTLSVKNSKGEIVELRLDKNSIILLDGKEAEAISVGKDKNAVIIYHQLDSDNILDAIYLP